MFGGNNKFQKAMHVAGKNSQSLLFPSITQSQQLGTARASDLQVRLPQVLGLVAPPQPEQVEQPVRKGRRRQEGHLAKVQTP